MKRLNRRKLLAARRDLEAALNRNRELQAALRVNEAAIDAIERAAHKLDPSLASFRARDLWYVMGRYDPHALD